MEKIEDWSKLRGIYTRGGCLFLTSKDRYWFFSTVSSDSMARFQSVKGGHLKIGSLHWPPEYGLDRVKFLLPLNFTHGG